MNAKKTILILLVISSSLRITGQENNCNNVFDSLAWSEYVYANMHYPLIDCINQAEGETVYQATTDSVGRFDIINQICSSGSRTLDNEARRLILGTPWRERCSSNKTYNITVNFSLADNKIYSPSEVEYLPEFEGGDTELFNYIRRNLEYPPEVSEKAVSGRVICGCVIEKDGTINIVETLRSIYPPLDAEAMRVIKKMPPWKPAKISGKNVRFYYLIPILFRLE
ncbi:MAG: energy transducer TonB [Tannerellaceae bacterium]|jgi:TonB family protein|nr:energy transducer TonB [Tannerellaceae bacterium]